MTLDQIAQHTQPGKSGQQLGYSFVYDLLLRDRRNKVKNVLEIGVLKGDSLRMWEEYFPKAMIYGIDLHTYPQYPDGKWTDRIQTFEVDQSKPEELMKVMLDICHPLDFISDDGSHKTEDQIVSLKFLLPYLADDGIYVIEDIYEIDAIKPFLAEYNHWFALPNEVDVKNKNYGTIMAIIQK